MLAVDSEHSQAMLNTPQYDESGRHPANSTICMSLDQGDLCRMHPQSGRASLPVFPVQLQMLAIPLAGNTHVFLPATGCGSPAWMLSSAAEMASLLLPTGAKNSCAGMT